MYQLFLKITFLSIILFHNPLSHAMLVSTTHTKRHRAQSIVNYYKYINSPQYLEGVYDDATKKRIPLNKALTTIQLLKLANHYFTESLPQSPLECKSLHETDKISRQEINLLQKKRLTIFKALPEGIAQEKIEDQFLCIKIRLREDEYLAWKNLVDVCAHEYNFNAKAMPYYEEFQELAQNFLKEKHENITHDATLPQKWIECLKNAMEKKNLDINNINLSHESKNKTTLAASLSPEHNIPGKISLNKNQWINLFFCDLSFIANHEVTHLYAGHGIIKHCTIAYIIEQISKSSVLDNTDKKKLYDKICNDPANISLKLAYERSADTLFALDDPESAYSAYLSCLYSGSYNYVALAHTNWRMLKLIDKKKKNPESSFIKIVVDAIYNLCC